MKIIRFDGEGRTVYHVVDNDAAEEYQPCVVSSGRSPEEAIDRARGERRVLRWHPGWVDYSPKPYLVRVKTRNTESAWLVPAKTTTQARLTVMLYLGVNRDAVMVVEEPPADRPLLVMVRS